MNHLIAAPIVIPALFAALTLLCRLRARRFCSILAIVGSVSLVLITIQLFDEARSGAIQAYALGDWPAPFGIVLVLDRLSALMLLLTSILSLIVLCHSVMTRLDRRGWHFHPLYQFLLAGLNGAFLTGDLFNLFVFFEVLLIASYGLMLHGQGARRLKAGIQYVIINLVGSTLFLIGVGALYGITGTLNMADLAVRIASLPSGDEALARSAALVLSVVFGLKAALLPLHLWLPRTYVGAAPAVAAMFAVMTKVGVYSIIRFTTLIFGDAANQLAWAPASWMLPAALLTAIVGFIGLAAARTLREQASFAIIGSTGTLLIAVAVFEGDALAAALYYLPGTTLACALLFLLADLIARRRTDYGGTLTVGPRFAQIELLSVLYMLGAIALVGMPPLAGFVGKLLILKATVVHPMAPWIWSVILSTTLLAIVGTARAGSTLFWKSSISEKASQPAPPSIHRYEMLPSMALIGLIAALVIGAGPATAYMSAVSEQLLDPGHYVSAVLSPHNGN